MPRTAWGWLVEPAELSQWLLYEDADLIALNKPAHLVCHPSKHGPWSSLAGACRQHWRLDKVHLPSHLDRETTGIVVVARHQQTASRLQQAMARRQVHKVYHALLYGQLRHPVTVTAPVGRSPGAAVVARRDVLHTGGQPAITTFEPLAASAQLTLARVLPLTGRRHQIRVHARALGHPIVGDKLYAFDERLFLEFLETGWTPRLASLLWLDHHALHCSSWRLHDFTRNYVFASPLPASWQPLLERHGMADIVQNALKFAPGPAE